MSWLKTITTYYFSYIISHLGLELYEGWQLMLVSTGVLLEQSLMVSTWSFGFKGFLERESQMEAASEVPWHYFRGTLYTLPDSKEENVTSQLEYLSHCKRNMWDGINTLVWSSFKNAACHTFTGRLISRVGKASKKAFISQVKGKWYFWHGPLLFILSFWLGGAATTLCPWCDRPIC